MNNIKVIAADVDNTLVPLRAGIGVCLLNWTDDTKACADFVTEYDVEHDGFAHFIKKNVLI